MKLGEKIYLIISLSGTLAAFKMIPFPPFANLGFAYSFAARKTRLTQQKSEELHSWLSLSLSLF